MSASETTLRLDHANALIKAIALHGRHFFWSDVRLRLATLELDKNGQVLFFDDYTGVGVNTHNSAEQWTGFSHGATLQSLVEQMRDYITTGKQISRDTIAPERPQPGSNLWGYSKEAAAAVRAAAFALPIMDPAAADRHLSEQPDQAAEQTQDDSFSPSPG